MSFTATYLGFDGETEEAFRFYQSIFGGEYEGGIYRYGNMPPMEGYSAIAEADKDLVMHVCLPILGGHRLMGADTPPGMGYTVEKGNNFHISLHPDSREEADRLFARLSEGGTVSMPMADQFWGDYFGDCTDKYGIRWMVNYNADYV